MTDTVTREPLWVAAFDGGFEARVYDVGYLNHPIGRLFMTTADGRIILSEKVDLDPVDRIDVWEQMCMFAIDIFETETV